MLKWPPLPVPYEQKNALALQRSSFRENPTYFLTSVGSWVCELVFDAIYDWRSEFSHNRQNDTQDNYSNPRCACAPRVNHVHTVYMYSKRRCSALHDNIILSECHYKIVHVGESLGGSGVVRMKVSLVPRPSVRGERKTWYTLHAHAR